MDLSITFIRHGMTDGNQERRYIGQLDDPVLNPTGIRQLEDARANKRYPKADALYVSPLRRCTETAQLLYPMLVPVVLPSLTELDFGAFDGKNYEQLKDDPAYRRWIDTAGAVAPPGGESGGEFTARLHGAMKQIAEDADHGQTLHPVVVTHGGCIMTILSTLATSNEPGAGDLYHFQVANGGGFAALMETSTQLLSRIHPI